jgi:hypothetical protein
MLNIFLVPIEMSEAPLKKIQKEQKPLLPGCFFRVIGTFAAVLVYIVLNFALAVAFESFFVGSAVLIGIACGMVSLCGAYQLYFNRQSRTWPTAEGTVLKSMLKEPTRYSAWSLCVTYRFQACGKTFTASRRTYTIAPFNGREKALETLKRYREGAPVQVYHNRSWPSLCVLEPNADTSKSVVLLVGGILLAAMVIPVALAGSFIVKE